MMIQRIVKFTTKQVLVMGKLNSFNSAWTVVTSIPHRKFFTIFCIELDIVDVAFVVKEDHVYLFELFRNSHPFQSVGANISELLTITHCSGEIKNAISIIFPVLELFDAYIPCLILRDHFDVTKAWNYLALFLCLKSRAFTD